MEIYETDEQRVEALKKWWKDNSSSVVVGLAMGFAVLAGWNAWQNTQQHKQQEASSLYSQLLKFADEKQIEPATKLAQRLVEQYQGTYYATYASLFEAKLKADNGDLAGAKKVLSDLLAASKDDNIKHLARIRLARVLFALNETDPALKLLESLKPKEMGSYESQYEELKGDLYSAQQRSSEALISYERAKASGNATPLLEMKIDNLAVDTSETATPAPAQ